MTYRELKEEVIDLGFDTRIDDPRMLVSATNRAIRHIRRFYPARERLTLTQREPLFLQPEEFSAKERRCFEADGVRALSFFYIGEGALTLELDDGHRAEQLASPRWRARRILLPSTVPHLRVTFEGAGLCVRHFSMHGAVDDTGCEGAVPLFADRVGYDLQALCPRMMYLAGTPLLGDEGAAVACYALEDGEFLLPCHLRGRVTVTVACNPRTAVLGDFNGEGEPDCPQELQDMLPLLVASYLWLDVEPEKAQYYKACFDEQLQMWRAQQKFNGDGKVVSRKGWR